MKPFVFHNITKIIFGDGAVPQVGAEAAAWGKKALLLYGQASIKRIGVYDQVVQSLRAAGVEFVELPGVKPNPVLSHTRQGIELVRREGIDVIVAVGGGSVLDESKAIAAGALVDHDVWEFFTQKEEIQRALPIVTVLTLPATGSEMNGGMVITHDETREKFGFSAAACQPKASILDPTTTYSVPANYVAYSAADSMTHLLESYFTHEDPWAPIQDRYAEGVVRSIIEATERILADPHDAQGRATMMWAATLAWNGLAPAGVGHYELVNHMMEHPLSGIFDIPHGAGLSIVLPAWMKWTAKRRPAKLAAFARHVMDIDEPDDARAALAGAEALKKWFDKIGTPTSLVAAGIPMKEIERVADEALNLGRLWGITRYTRDDLLDIYRMAE
jgi:hypothetical protein